MNRARKIAAACIIALLLEEEEEEKQEEEEEEEQEEEIEEDEEEEEEEEEEEKLEEGVEEVEEVEYQAKRARKQRSMWVRPLFKEDNQFYGQLRRQLQRNDPELYNNFLKMSADDFDCLLEKIAPLITKKNTCMREAICPGERLAITLRFLATGDNYSGLMFLFKRSKAVICNIVSEVCSAIHSGLKDEFLKMPLTADEWKNISNEFNERCNFPNCFGAIGGKHVPIAAPANGKGQYLNYKKQNTIVLMTLVDAQCNFTFVDIGAKGSDGCVFSRSELSRVFEDSTINLPSNTPLPGRQIPIPYVMVGDEAFPLKPYIMKPYNSSNQPERIFNIRLSRARCVIENALGIASARFRILRKPIDMAPDNAVKVVFAVCTLHNFLMKRKSVYSTTTDFDHINTDGSVTEGNWRKEVNYEKIQHPLETLRFEERTDYAEKVREEFKKYFMEQGDIEWEHKNTH